MIRNTVRSIHMKYKRLAASFTICMGILHFNSAAAHTSDWYIAGSYGQGKPSQFYTSELLERAQIKNAHIFGVALGRSFHLSKYTARAEIALNHFHNPEYKINIIHPGDIGEIDFMKQKLHSTAAFGNIAIDLANIRGFVPYIGGGAGLIQHTAGDYIYVERDASGTSMDIKNKGKKHIAFAWNIGAGLSYQINQRITLDLIHYRFYHLGKFSTYPDKFGDPEIACFKMHSIATGIKLSF